MMKCLSQGKLFKLRYVYISKCSSRESCLKMRYEYIMAFFSQGKLFKVAVCIYHRMFISRKVV